MPTSSPVIIMSFNACAIELYSEIMKYADRASLLSSACVSKTFASEVRRHLYHTIDVSSLAAENEKVNLIFVKKVCMLTIL